MKISRISIRNFMGLEDMEFAAGKLTVADGQNGTGKTSILEAIKTALNGGAHDATMLRRGAESGEIVLIFDDESKLTKTITPTKSDIEMRGPTGAKLSAPAGRIKELVDQLSANPVEFLTARPKDRSAVLLEAMPINVSPARLKEIVQGMPIVSTQLSGLDLIDSTAKAVYDERTAVNRSARDKEGAARQILSAIGDEDQDRLQSAVDDAIEDEKKLQESLDSEIAGVNKSEARDISDCELAISEIRRAAELKISDVQKELSVKRAGSGRARELIQAQYSETLSAASGKRNGLQERFKQAVRAKKARDDARAAEVDATELKAKGEGLTRMLESIQAYREELLSNLPISGLEVKNGDIYRDGVQFDRLNTAQKVDIAIQVASLRAKGLGVVCVDGLECLDPDTWEAFKSAAVSSGLQLFVTRVSENPLTVEAVN